MTAATKTQVRTQTVNIAPAPCRMIRVQVLSDDKGDGAYPYFVAWDHVVGIMCAPSREFPDRIDVWPVVVGDTPWDGEICVVDEHHDPDNVAFKAVAPCFWPPEQDKEHAIRIAKELIAKDGEIGNWASIPVEPRKGEEIGASVDQTDTQLTQV